MSTSPEAKAKAAIAAKTVSATAIRLIGKAEAKKLPPVYKPEDRVKQMEDENRSLRIKFKSIESQISKNDAEATSKLNK